MMQRPPPAEPFESTSNVIVWLVVIAIMIAAHFCWWLFGHKYEADTGLTSYFEYVIDLVYNWVLT